MRERQMPKAPEEQPMDGELPRPGEKRKKQEVSEEKQEKRVTWILFEFLSWIFCGGKTWS